MNNDTMLALTRIQGTAGAHSIDLTISINPGNEAKAIGAIVEGVIDTYLDRAPNIMTKIAKAAPTLVAAINKFVKAMQRAGRKAV